MEQQFSLLKRNLEEQDLFIKSKVDKVVGKRAYCPDYSLVNDLVFKLLDYEKYLINKILSDHTLLKEFCSIDNPTEDIINLMLFNNGDKNIPFKVHKFIISKLIHKLYFDDQNVSVSDLSKSLYCFGNYDMDSFFPDLDINYFFQNISKEHLPLVLENLHISYLNSNYEFLNGDLKLNKSKIGFKDRGSVYTPIKIAEEITRLTINSRLLINNDLKKLRILDFGCGTGRFYESAFYYLKEDLGLNEEEIISKILFAIDIDPIAIDILKIKVLSFLRSYSLNTLQNISQNIISKNMLITSDFGSEEFYVNYSTDFKEPIGNGGFNVIISNPPYFLLKVNRKGDKNKVMSKYYGELTKRLEEEIRFFRKSSLYNYSIEGMLNYYRLSIEMMLKISSADAEIGVICPSSLFADISSRKLRRHLLLKNNLRRIKFFGESAKLFQNVSQATVIFFLNKSGKTNELEIENGDDKFKINLSTIEKAFSGNYEIPQIDQAGWKILEKISNLPKIKEINYIRNKRGELDLSLNKEFITKGKTGYRLIRGNMIGDNYVKNKNSEYVMIDDFLKRKSNEFKINDFKRKRLACQQICNLEMKKRLRFTIVDERDILANSCNYISLKDNSLINRLNILLNSYLLDWRFKLTSTNNHINNYELDELPIVSLDEINENIKDELQQNIHIFKLYGLNMNETISILQSFFKKEEIESKWKKY